MPDLENPQPVTRNPQPEVQMTYRDWPEEWEAAASEIAARPGTTLILGASDTGKSTLARLLIRRWCKLGLTVALVDGDVGQSMLGPPTTIGMARFSSSEEDPERTPPERLRFVGNISPHGHILDIVVGLRRLVDRALEANANPVVDTTGMVFGRLARQLKSQEIEVLSPTYLLAIQRSDEIEHLLAPHRTRETPITYRLPVPEGVRNKSRERRRAFRTRKFRAYFEQARPIEFRMEDIAFQGLPLGSGTRLGPEDRVLLRNTIGAEVIYGERSADILFVITRENCSEEAISRGRTVLGEKLMVISRDHLSDLLVGLNDREGYTLGLGILRGMDLTAGCITVLTPVREVTRVRAIHFGSLRIDTAGKELGHISVI